MSHQPYEDWLLDQSHELKLGLSHEAESELQDHLRECEICRRLAGALYDTEYELKRAPMIAPDPGFLSRWENRLDADRMKSQHRQSIRILTLNICMAMVSLILLIALALPLIGSPTMLLWTYLYQLLRVVSLASVVKQFIASLLQSVDITIPIFIWVLVAGVLSQLAVLWIVSYRSLTNQRRVEI